MDLPRSQLPIEDLAPWLNVRRRVYAAAVTAGLRADNPAIGVPRSRTADCHEFPKKPPLKMCDPRRATTGMYL